MKTLIYYNGKLLHTVIHPKSVKDPKEAVQDTKDKLRVVLAEENPEQPPIHTKPLEPGQAIVIKPSNRHSLGGKKARILQIAGYGVSVRLDSETESSRWLTYDEFDVAKEQ